MAHNVIAESNFSTDESADNSASGFIASVEFAQETDLFAALAKAYLAMFGLTDEKIIRQFTLFANQYRKADEVRTSELTAETQNFRGQDDLIKAFKQTVDRNGYLIKNWTIKISVKNWFLERLKQFGIDFTLDNLTGKVNLTSVNPIPMIDKSDMRTGDIVLVGGHGSVSKVIRTATWSGYSHAAIYDGIDSVYEALGGGMVETPFNTAIDRCNPVAVLRLITHNPAVSIKALEYAKKITAQKKLYDIQGAVSSGLSWKAAIIISPLLSLKIASEATNVILGDDFAFFCSEAVAQSYVEAGTPIIATKPQNTVPGALYYSPNLTLIGFLVNRI
jgi:hypothetical protein